MEDLFGLRAGARWGILRAAAFPDDPVGGTQLGCLTASNSADRQSR